MIDVSTLFMLIAGIVFLGYILNALFYKLKISNILPLLLIGLAIGPMLHLVDTSPSSIVVQVSPFVTALAIAFVLFDVGMGIRFSSLRNILLQASKFTILTSMITGIAMTLVFYYVEGWSTLFSLMAGFAISGTSSVTLPSLFKVAKVTEDTKTTLAYQSVFNDVFSLVIPLIFFNIIATGQYTATFVAGELAGFVIGSLVLGILFAAFWVFILKKFRRYSSEYSWMLTLTMVLAIYGTSEYLHFNGALSTFIFGILLANISDMKFLVKSYVKPVLSDVSHIKVYQKEITFFVSTFFFVYIGMLFDLQGLQYVIVALVVAMCVIMLLIRYFTTLTLGRIIPNGKHEKSNKSLIRLYVAQGLAPAIIATLPATIGIAVPNFIDIVFLVILISNGILSLGLYRYAKLYAEEIK
ncbi:MAG: cation:proton antiporter [Candidatus Micrarchaeota archaeon]|nr:cation:proton antiporter [Candidatus Micrarchaeota archaeon]